MMKQWGRIIQTDKENGGKKLTECLRKMEKGGPR